jgi:flagellar protein FliO/FliZ
MTPNGSSALWLLLVIAAIPVALWLLRRTPLGRPSAAGLARTVGVLPLSTSQRVVTVEIGQGELRRWLVLGVTPHAIHTLHTMAPLDDAPATPSAPTLAPATASPAKPFAALLHGLRARPGDPDAR